MNGGAMYVVPWRWTLWGHICLLRYRDRPDDRMSWMDE